MAEDWVATAAGGHLAGRRKESTAPEVLLRRAVHAAGGRFRLHRRLAKGCTPDFVLPGRGVAVFVDGCFWHGCPEHGRKKPWTGPNAALWEEKMQRNAERDVRSTQLAQELGWRVVRVWECAIQGDPAGAAALVLQGGQPPGSEPYRLILPHGSKSPKDAASCRSTCSSYIDIGGPAAIRAITARASSA